ncbi:hypothetical protein [Metabacillus dongyingensis]|uniref:hypothetical protein n=1 Tax=Metabacillus dongyingensis TaxID=2874282 RepID=UPI001FB21D80|nr:hypothetical protein [Metabacillus dongyingensis]
MSAFVAKDENDTHFLYKSAIKDLKHIKYYYVEGIYFFAKHLKEIQSDEYIYWYEKGIGLAKKHWYRFLVHQFQCLDSGSYTEYNEENYPIPLVVQDTYIAQLNRYLLKSLEEDRKKINFLFDNR